MINWYAEYLLNRARRLGERRSAASRPGKPLAYRLGAALTLIGRSLQGTAASGR